MSDTIKERHIKIAATRRLGGFSLVADLIERGRVKVRLAEARELAGLTQPEVAELLQVHWRTVQEWESPKNDNVPFRRMDELADKYGTSSRWLLHGDEVMQPSVALDQLVEEVDGLRRELEDQAARNQRLELGLRALEVLNQGIDSKIQGLEDLLRDVLSGGQDFQASRGYRQPPNGS